jgi:hypothetical protein
MFIDTYEFQKTVTRTGEKTMMNWKSVLMTLNDM